MKLATAQAHVLGNLLNAAELYGAAYRRAYAAAPETLADKNATIRFGEAVVLLMDFAHVAQLDLAALSWPTGIDLAERIIRACQTTRAQLPPAIRQAAIGATVH